MRDPDPVSAFDQSSRAPVSDRPPQIRPWHLQRVAAVYMRQSSPEQVKNNTGSTAVQRDLAALARAWGWADSLIDPIDEDLGKSAARSSSKRTGFQRLLESIDAGRIGVVLLQNLGRVSRNATDAVRFVEAARRAKILVYADEHFYDMATEDDAQVFFQIIQGLLGWLDNANRVRQFRAAREAKARLGHAVSRPPIGYVKGVHGQWVKDPDPEVQKIISQIFQLALKLGSVAAVVRYMRENSLPFPHRRHGELTWGLPSRARLYSVLISPLYTGDYVYKRVKIIPGTDEASRRIEPRPEAERIVSEGHHEAYVTKDDWRAIMAALAARRPTVRPIVGKGNALLQGLLRCGQCHRWLRTQYSAHDGQARGASYVCRPMDQNGKPRHSVSFSARLGDHAVVREVLGALTPAEIDQALTAINSAGFQEKEIQRSHERQLLQFEEEAELAYRTFQKATESSQRVRAAAGQKYDQALERLETLKERLARSVPPRPVSITARDAAELQALTEKIQELWSVDAITNEDRKRLLHTVIAEIIVHGNGKEAVELEIVWIGGLRQVVRALRPVGVDQLIAEARKAGKDPAAIAHQLRSVGLNPREQRHQVLSLIRQLLIERCPRTEMLKIVQRDAPSTLGHWTRQRLNQYVSRLYRGVPGIPPLRAPSPSQGGSAEASGT